MIAKPYGKIIWRSLPPMRRTREQQDVVRYLEALRAVESA
jgi:ATP-dependent DNA helicase DinG